MDISDLVLSEEPQKEITYVYDKNIHIILDGSLSITAKDGINIVGGDEICLDGGTIHINCGKSEQLHKDNVFMKEEILYKIRQLKLAIEQLQSQVEEQCLLP